MVYSPSNARPVHWSFVPQALYHRLFARAPLHTRSKSRLPPGFVDYYRDGVGEIETPASRDHREADTLLRGDGSQNLSRQPAAFRTKHKGIAGNVVDQIVPLGAFGGNGKQAAAIEALHALCPTLMDRNCGELVIVQSRSQ